MRRGTHKSLNSQVAYSQVLGQATRKFIMKFESSFFEFHGADHLQMLTLELTYGASFD